MSDGSEREGARAMPTARARGRDRLVDLLARDHLLVVVLAALAALLALLAPHLLVADSWLTLVAGREIVAHGLPGTEELTSIPFGREWVDQQWLAHLSLYGAEQAGGLRAVLGVGVGAVVAAFALVLGAGRVRGASSRSTLLVAIPCLVVAPWAWQLRAQTVALPLFAGVLALVSTDQRLQRRRTLLVAPLLVLWANVHGSVVLGAAVVSLAGLVALAARAAGRDAPRPGRAAACAVLPWVAVLASPYATDLPGYYRTFLLDDTIAEVATEWGPPAPQGWTLVFFALAVATVVLAVWQRRRLSALDLAVLALTLVAALRSERAIVWFALAVAAVLPLAADGILGRDPGRPRRGPGVAVAACATAAGLVALAVGLARSGSEPADEWPPGALAALAAPETGAVLADERFANWLLWRVPGLRGRIAYDVRFELLTAAELDELVAYRSLRPGWENLARRYDTIVVGRRSLPDHPAALEALGAREVYADGTLVVLTLPDRP